MPLNLTSGAQVAGNTAFQARVAIGFYFVAREVYNEATNTEGHEVRVRYAQSIIGRDFSEFQKLAAMILTDSTVYQALPAVNPDHTTVADTVILEAIRTAWNKLAGVGM